ncbi:MAG: adenine-specific methyltransferase EcoRI family protein [Bacteroidaceae bacterium]|nr:adenine-specific methyltransferase EcoRI family protein [Prevotellaceae bacterium]MDY5631695.1 adenine-specific methyltransferase EcoRI family protein [Bacteroidaceae bacterium]
MANTNLKEAKAAKNDEFYTQFHDIEIEMNAYLEYDPDVFRGKTVLLPCDDPEWSNFTRYFAAKFDELGLKKLISTSYAPDSKKYKTPYLPSLFEQDAPQFDPAKAQVKGKIFILDHDHSGDGRINIDDLEWEYMEGDGDFRSKEVTDLRNEADFIITNPPFSLFRDFLAWIIEGGKKFAVIGNMNAITYKEVFPLIKDNKVWLGATGNGNDMVFGVPKGAKIDEKDRAKAARLGYVGNYTRLGNSCWFTSIEHGRRHEPIPLMTMADNLRYSKHKELKGKTAYDHYDNYDAIEVPFTDAIPSDYKGVMGVPISFLIKYCPEQFEILGATESEGKGFSNGLWIPDSHIAQPLVHSDRVYKRIFISHII